MFIEKFSRIILPLKYEMYEDILSYQLSYQKDSKDKTETKIINLWEITHFPSNHLLKTTVEKFSGSKASICDIYRFNANARKQIGLPNNHSELITFTTRQSEPIDLNFADIHLFVFETGIIFLTFDIIPQVDHLEAYSEALYFITEFKTEANKFTYQQRISKTEKATVSFRMIELIDRLLPMFKGLDDFDAYTEGYHFSDSKPNAYSYLLLKEKPQDLDRNLFKLMYSFKSSYLNKTELKMNEITVKPFENTIWGATHNACVNISCLTDNSETNEFFKHNFTSHVKNHYFLLYLLAIHQKYAIILFTENITQMNVYDIDNVEVYDMIRKVKRLMKESELFYIRSYVEIPSYMEHVNKYYYYLQEQFEIKRYHTEFKETLNALHNIFQALLDKRNSIDKLVSDRSKVKREILIFVITTIIAVNPLLKNGWDVTEYIVGRSLSFYNWQLFWVYILLIGLGVYAFFGITNRIDEIKQINKDLQSKEL